MAWIRAMGGGAGKPKITNVLEYLKQTNGWSIDSSATEASSVRITYGTNTTLYGEYRNSGSTAFTSATIDVKNAKKLIASYTFSGSESAMRGVFRIYNADTKTILSSTDKQSQTNREIDITYVDRIFIVVTLGLSGLNYYSGATMTVSKLMLE